MDDGRCCQYCWRPTSIGGHNDGCPVISPELMAQWKEGFDYGWEDNIIQQYNARYYPPTFYLGYRAGKAKIDELVDNAAQSRCFG